MTLVASFSSASQPPIIVSDVLITAETKGEYARLATNWLNSIGPFTNGYEGVELRQKIFIINDDVCVAWAGDMAAAQNAIANIQLLFQTLGADAAFQQAHTYVANEVVGKNFGLLLHYARKEGECINFLRFSTFRNVSKLGVQATVGGSAQKLVFDGRTSMPKGGQTSEISNSKWPIGDATAASRSIILDCLIAEIANPEFTEFRFGGHYEVTVWDDGWKTLDLTINILRSNSGGCYKLLRYSRIVHEPPIPIFLSIAPIEFALKEDDDSIFGFVLPAIPNYEFCEWKSNFANMLDVSPIGEIVVVIYENPASEQVRLVAKWISSPLIELSKLMTGGVSIHDTMNFAVLDELRVDAEDFWSQ